MPRERDGAPVTAPVVRVTVDPHDAELASGELWALGATAIEERPGQLIAGFGTVEGAVETAALLSARWPAEAVDIDSAEIDAAFDAWREFAGPVRAGAHLVVVPAWLPHEEVGRPGDYVVRIDPGRAFGSGAHPTTRGMLTACERYVTRGASVLDLGCGSGVLAVTAAVLGAGRVVAVDVDADARRATTANAFLNGVNFEVVSSINDVSGRFDVVLANIGGVVLVDLAKEVLAHVAAGGAVVLGGMLARRWAAVVEAYEGLTVARVAELAGWSTVALRALL
jgi:ribosomal protein L11 methylase PrmA